jgi:cation diffusion facilitator family transporter
MNQQSAVIKTRVMRITLIVSAMLMAIKFFAYWLTNSNAILTDALESIINVVAGLFALVSLSIAILPKDENHPYGHGKVEYLSAGFEGGLIFLAGVAIIVKSIYGFFHPAEIKSLDKGAWIVGFAGVCNYVMGTILVRYGKKHNSVLLIADGKHLISDTVSSIGLILGLIVIQITGRAWLDNVLAMIFGAVIFYTGFKLLRVSVTSLLDEADYEKLKHMIKVLNENRRPKWIDMHNLRVLKYGSELHVDCHITLPWYDTLEEAHNEVDQVENLLSQNMDDEVEFFIHSDPCLPACCPICKVEECTYRKAPFVKKLDWTIENMLPDRQHQLLS